MPGYDRIARYYDRLSRLVYGRTLVNAQVWLLHEIPPGARVLIAGGGSGWIIEEIARLHPAGLSITCVDASARMMAMARKRNAGANDVVFITAIIEQAGLDKMFDVVLTPFLFDSFTEAAAEKAFARIDAALAPQGKWLYCDYRNSDVWWHRLLLRAMYLFFRAMGSIDARRLPEMEKYFSQYRYNMTQRKAFFKNFIAAIVYKKAE